MPGGIVKTKADEKDWEKAKEIAEEAGKKDNWAYITGIFKNMNPDRFSSIVANVVNSSREEKIASIIASDMLK